MKPSQLRSVLLLLMSCACSGKVVLGGLPDGTGGGRDATTGGGQSADPVDPCAQTTQQATAILSQHCAGCHEGGGNVPGAPLNFILDFARLEATASPTVHFGGKVYLVPGDPEASLIYSRAVIDRDMPFYGGLVPQLNASEGSLLQYWITSCLN